MSENTPKVSIIIPVYNVEAYLRGCLDSVVNQTLQEIEIICVDDASQDGSSEILAEYAQRDSRIQVITYETNKSASQARKDGVFIARGDYVLFCDADDELELTACEDLIKLIAQHDVDILQFGTYVEAEITVQRSTVAAFERFAAPYTQYLRGRGVFDGCFQDRKYRFNLWNKIYKADLCKKAFAHVEDGAFPKAEDLYAFFMIAWYAESYYGITDKYYHYKYGRGITGEARRTSVAQFKRHCSENRVAQKCRAFLMEQNAWDAYEHAWNRMNQDFVAECVGYWLSSVDEADGAETFDILLQSWDAKVLIDILKQVGSGKTDYINQKSRDSTILNGKTVFEYEEAILAERLMDSADAQIPAGFERIIPVVFATNDGYAPYAGVAIQSILENASPENFYRIYILHDSLRWYNIAALEGIESKQVSVKCVNVADLIARKKARFYEKAYFTKEMYYRFLIADIFPCYKQVIYLDCDLVALSDVAYLAEIDLGNHLLAAVRDIALPQAYIRLKRNFNLDANDYFNSGVLVINVKQWREEKTVETCFELLRTIPNRKLLCCDQDILNIACEGRISYLDPSWNFMWHMVYGSAEYVKLCKDRVNEIQGQYKILHFASDIKPWKILQSLPLSRFFWQYAKKSCFYEEILIKNANKISGKEEKKLSTPQQMVNQEIWDSQHFGSYRMGRLITFIPRKIRGGIRCLQEHGWSYTWQILLEQLGL